MNPLIEAYVKSLHLQESPMRTGRYFSTEMDSNVYNAGESLDILKTAQKVHHITDTVTPLTLYRKEYRNNLLEDYWMTDQPLTAVCFILEPKNSGIQLRHSWNHRHYKSTARTLLLSYYLPQYDYIESDNSHTDQGVEMWKKLIQEAPFAVVVLPDGREVDVDDADSYWGNTSAFWNYTFRIRK